jgi:hypothetical protein
LDLGVARRRTLSRFLILEKWPTEDLGRGRELKGVHVLEVSKVIIARNNNNTIRVRMYRVDMSDLTITERGCGVACGNMEVEMTTTNPWVAAPRDKI